MMTVLIVLYPSLGAVSAQDTGCQNQTLPITVRDVDGKPLRGLAPPDFEAKIHGTLAPVLSIEPDARPHRLIILLDMSASMGEERQAKPWLAATALALHLTQSSGPRTQLGLILFAEKIDVEADFSKGNAFIISRLKEIVSDPVFPKKEVRGRTPLYDAIAKGFQLLDHPTSADVLYVISDGGDNFSRLHPSDVQRLLAPAMVRVFAAILQNRVSLHTPTPEELTGPEDLAKLVEKTGGMTLSLAQFSPAGNRWAVGTQDNRATWEELMVRFYRCILENDLITLQIPSSLHKRERLQLRFSEASRKKWKDAQIFFPSEIEPCTPRRVEHP